MPTVKPKLSKPQIPSLVARNWFSSGLPSAYHACLSSWPVTLPWHRLGKCPMSRQLARHYLSNAGRSMRIAQNTPAYHHCSNEDITCRSRRRCMAICTGWLAGQPTAPSTRAARMQQCCTCMQHLGWVCSDIRITQLLLRVPIGRAIPPTRHGNYPL